MQGFMYLFQVLNAELNGQLRWYICKPDLVCIFIHPDMMHSFDTSTVGKVLSFVFVTSLRVLSAISMTFVVSILFNEAFHHINLNSFCRISENMEQSVKKYADFVCCTLVISVFRYLNIIHLEHCGLLCCYRLYLVQAPKICQWKYLSWYTDC